MPTEDRAISDFPIALQLLNTALVLISNPDGQGGYDSYQATLTELGRVVLETQYTQDLGNVDVFNAIKNCRTLSGTSNPTAQQGADGQLYVKYQTVSNVTSVLGLYVKLSGSWCEISTGGGGDVGIECTQAQYDAWEQAGTLLQDTNYYITDGQSGGGVVIDDTTASASTVYSSLKTQGVFDSHDGDFADAYDDTATYNTGDYCIYNNTLYKCNDDNVTGTWDAQYWDDTTIAEELDALNTGKQDKIADTVAKTVTFDVTPDGGEVKAKVYNRVLYVSGYFRFSSNQSANTQLLHISDVTLAMEYYESCYTDGSATVRFKLTNDGKLINENQFQANQWVSISLACLLA